MSNIVFRPVNGISDAADLIAVQNQCNLVDTSDPLSLLEDHPTVEEYAGEIAQSAPLDWVIAEAEGQIIGYGHTLWDWSESDGTHVLLHLGWVVPAWRGKGIGTELLERLESRCREKATTLPATRYEYGANADGRQENASQHLRANGYEVGYTLWEMERPVALPVSEAVLPASYELRPVIPEHHRAIWQCIGDAYDVSRPNGRFVTIAGEGSYQGYFTGASADPSLWFVAWQGSRVAGQVLCRIRFHRSSAGPEETLGEIYEVSIGYAHRRRGLAKALLLMGIAALHARGVSTVRLYTVYENPTFAWRLYEQVGFQKIATFPRWRKAFAR